MVEVKILLSGELETYNVKNGAELKALKNKMELEEIEKIAYFYKRHELAHRQLRRRVEKLRRLQIVTDIYQQLDNWIAEVNFRELYNDILEAIEMP